MTGPADRDIEALLAALPKGARLLGVDLGTKTVGLALSDVERRIATPLETLKRTKFTPDATAIRAIVERFGVGGLVFGLPLNMDGSEGPRAQSTRAFVRNMAPRLARPVLFWDERLSTLVVTRTLIDADATRAQRADAVDKMAAAYILQGALDRYARLGPFDADEGDGTETGFELSRVGRKSGPGFPLRPTRQQEGWSIGSIRKVDPTFRSDALRGAQLANDGVAHLLRADRIGAGRCDVLRARAGGEHIGDCPVEPVRRLDEPEGIAQPHRERADHRDRVCKALAGDVGRRTVHGFVERLAPAGL